MGFIISYQQTFRRIRRSYWLQKYNKEVASYNRRRSDRKKVKIMKYLLKLQKYNVVKVTVQIDYPMSVKK